MKRLFKYVFILIFIAHSSFLISCEPNQAMNENSSINSETSSEDSSINSETSSEDSSVNDETSSEDSSVNDETSSEDSSVNDETSSEDSSVNDETSSEDSSVNDETCHHDYIWKVIKEPTCTTYGEKKGICPICLEITYRAIAFTEHDYIGAFCKFCDATKKPDFYVPNDFSGGLTIKEIENKLAFFNLSLDSLAEIELSSLYINNEGILSLSFTYEGFSASIAVSDLQCNYAVETPSLSTIQTLYVTRSSQLNVYVIDVNNQESYIGSLNGTGKIQRLFVNENNDLFVVYNNNATFMVGSLYVQQTDEVEMVESDGIIYRKIAGKREYAVNGLIEAKKEHVYIRTTINGLPVTMIDDYAFAGNNYIKSVRIGNQIRTIGNWAFWNCSSLQTIYLPNTPIKIRSGIFYETNLSTVYYEGTEDNKKENIIISTISNELLFECTWIYNYTFND